MINLKGKTVLITGGSRGLGKACAVMFADAGAKIGINYVAADNTAQELKSEIEKHSGICELFKGDITKENTAKKIVDDFVKTFGQIDILINNAGIWKEAPVDEMTEKQLDETMNINLKAVFFVTKYVVKHMKKMFSGSIIIISSTAGKRGEAFIRIMPPVKELFRA